MRQKQKRINPLFQLSLELLLFISLGWGLRMLADYVVFLDDQCNYQQVKK